MALVAALGSEPRRPDAYRRLLRIGTAAVPAIIEGLAHPVAMVRENCCRLLDHLLVEEAMPDLVAMLDDPAPEVRIAAVHALSCERCKQGACRPDRAALLPLGVRVLRDDPDARVRAYAVELVALWVHDSAAALAALIGARDGDPSPAVRKKAGWYTPGGPIHRRTAPREHLRVRAPART